jgi:AcrR family transcriptional regulator
MTTHATADESDTRQAIMRATYRALCEHGYADLSMQDIADELDKSRSLLHYHYDTREDLLLSFVDNLVGWIDARLDETDVTDPRARLLEYVDHFVVGPDDDEQRDFVVALFELRMQAVHNEAFREKLARHYRKNVEAAASIIEEGIESGVFRPVDPDETAEAIYNAIEGARFYQVVLGADGAARRMQDALLEYVMSDFVAVPEVLSDEFGPGER